VATPGNVGGQHYGQSLDGLDDAGQEHRQNSDVEPKEHAPLSVTASGSGETLPAERIRTVAGA